MGAASLTDPAFKKHVGEIFEKTKKGKPTEKLSKKNIGCIFHKTLQL